MDIEFKSARELYMKVIPALNTKRRILTKKGIKISDKEIFEYLVKNIWSTKEGLALCDIVNDILSTNDDVFRKVKE